MTSSGEKSERGDSPVGWSELDDPFVYGFCNVCEHFGVMTTEDPTPRSSVERLEFAVDAVSERLETWLVGSEVDEGAGQKIGRGDPLIVHLERAMGRAQVYVDDAQAFEGAVVYAIRVLGGDPEAVEQAAGADVVKYRSAIVSELERRVDKFARTLEDERKGAEIRRAVLGGSLFEARRATDTALGLAAELGVLRERVSRLEDELEEARRRLLLKGSSLSATDGLSSVGTTTVTEGP